MSKVAFVAALLVLGACAPQAEEAAPAAETEMAAPAPAPATDSAMAPADTMARDTTASHDGGH